MRSVRIFDCYILYENGDVYSEYVGRMLTPHSNGRGYLQIVPRDCGMPVNVRIHRLVAEHFVPNPYGLPEVNHIDGNKLNNHSSNLEWCDRTFNIQHAYDNGLRKRPNGTNNPRNIISEEVVREICEELLRGGKTAKIARSFNVNWHNVDAIRKKRNWKQVSDEYFDNVV